VDVPAGTEKGILSWKIRFIIKYINKTKNSKIYIDFGDLNTWLFAKILTTILFKRRIII
jgi:hypothetical protein